MQLSHLTPGYTTWVKSDPVSFYLLYLCSEWISSVSISGIHQLTKKNNILNRLIDMHLKICFWFSLSRVLVWLFQIISDLRWHGHKDAVWRTGWGRWGQFLVLILSLKSLMLRTQTLFHRIKLELWVCLGIQLSLMKKAPMMTLLWWRLNEEGRISYERIKERNTAMHEIKREMNTGHCLPLSIKRGLHTLFFIKN